MKHMPNRALIVIGAALALGIGGGIAVAQIPSSDGTITACMTPPAGTVRLIDAEAGATCKKGEKKVTWNEAGQPGEDGVSGYETVTKSDDRYFLNSEVDEIFDEVACPVGKVVVGGGATATWSPIGPVESADVLSSVASADNTGWTAEFGKRDGTNFDAGGQLLWTIRVHCVTAE